MKILVTGANGFIGKNLTYELKNRGFDKILQFNRDTNIDVLGDYIKQADFIFHLAGANRPKDDSEYIKDNVDLTVRLIESIKESRKKVPILICSSVQAILDNEYGKSKKKAEEMCIQFMKENDNPVYIYRLTNVFGKWCKPNYNSVVATFCNNIARDIPISIDNPQRVLKLVYIDDVVNEFIKVMINKESEICDFYEIPLSYNVSVEKISDLIQVFHECRNNLMIPNTFDEFENKLYATYLSYVPDNQLKYSLDMNIDNRGSFTEFIHTRERGQVSINKVRVGIVKGNHWHNTKNEKFVVVYGKGIIRLRQILSDCVVEYIVDGEKLDVVDIPPGYVHNIENIGDTELVFIIWTNEIFDKKHPDTYYANVN